MLLQFAFKNFKSFREEAALDMRAARMTDFNNHVIPIEQERILPAAAIFGANAAGKSNAMEAFLYMQKRVCSFCEEDPKKADKNQSVLLTPFLLDEKSREGSSAFEVYFMDLPEDGARSWNYGFCVDRNGVCEEWLNIKARTVRKFKRVFYRSKEKLDFSGLPKNCRDNLQTALDDQTLVVSLGALLKVEPLRRVRNWFAGNQWCGARRAGENTVFEDWLPDGFEQDVQVQKWTADFLSLFDETVCGFRIESAFSETESENGRLAIEVGHWRDDMEKLFYLPLRLESSGLRKLLFLYRPISKALETGAAIFADDLDQHLHPLLVRALVTVFSNPQTNPRHAQLIFTSHDAWQLCSRSLRRDEIWFVQKDASGCSSLYSLADFVDEDGIKIRKDENYQKNYLLGKYGAIPDLERFERFWND